MSRANFTESGTSGFAGPIEDLIGSERTLSSVKSALVDMKDGIYMAKMLAKWMAGNNSPTDDLVFQIFDRLQTRLDIHDNKMRRRK